MKIFSRCNKSFRRFLASYLCQPFLKKDGCIEPSSEANVPAKGKSNDSNVDVVQVCPSATTSLTADCKLQICSFVTSQLCCEHRFHKEMHMAMYLSLIVPLHWMPFVQTIGSPFKFAGPMATRRVRLWATSQQSFDYNHWAQEFTVNGHTIEGVQSTSIRIVDRIKVQSQGSRSKSRGLNRHKPTITRSV